jgi:hypothetical protein
MENRKIGERVRGSKTFHPYVCSSKFDLHLTTLSYFLAQILYVLLCLMNFVYTYTHSTYMYTCIEHEVSLWTDIRVFNYQVIWYKEKSSWHTFGEESGCNLGRNIGYPNWKFSFVSSVPPRNLRGSFLRWSRGHFSNSWFTNYPTIPRHTVSDTHSIVK